MGSEVGAGSRHVEHVAKRRVPRQEQIVMSGRNHSRVVAEDLFRDVVVNERKRAVRDGRRSVLVRIAVDDPACANSPSTWARVIEALEGILRTADVLGWLHWRSVMGVLLTDVGEFDVSESEDLKDRIRRRIESRLPADMCRRCSIRVVQPETFDDSGAKPAQHAALPNIPYASIKRTFDVSVSLFLLILLSPLFVLIALLVKYRSPGPVFFHQVRIGENMKPFTMLKFRTMHMNADHAVHRDYVTWYINSSSREAKAAGGAGVFKLTNDPRITPVGRFLRKTSLDELPQLWNVFRGEMSLVGPRPPIPYETEQYQPWHYRRVVEAKPGITGLWQVTGRSRTTFDDMVRLDLRYARACSFWTDLKILLATPRAVIMGKGAC
jgi:exopolysaccharide biosynthesis polyprenyl glycosylphosphotransferase